MIPYLKTYASYLKTYKVLISNLYSSYDLTTCMVPISYMTHSSFSSSVVTGTTITNLFFFGIGIGGRGHDVPSAFCSVTSRSGSAECSWSFSRTTNTRCYIRIHLDIRRGQLDDFLVQRNVCLERADVVSILLSCEVFPLRGTCVVRDVILYVVFVNL